jgi:hypothetical protein
MMQLIEMFQSWDFDVHFSVTAPLNDLVIPLTELGVTPHQIALNDASFDVFVSDLAPDLVLFDRFIAEEQFGWRVAENCPEALRILDSEDLHSLRMARKKAVAAQETFTETHWLSQELTLRELASIYRCDLTLIISQFEMDWLARFGVAQSILVYLPFLLKETDIPENVPGYMEREHFVCIGNGLHAPNVDGFRWLYNEIWPGIRKRLPQAELHIYGGHLPESVRQLHKPEKGFLVQGWCKDVGQTMAKARVNLAPLRFGAGLKGKVLEGIKQGTPTVTTAVGAEGMVQEGLVWPGAICASIAGFIEQAVHLYSQAESWEACMVDREKLLSSYDFTFYSKEIWSVLDKLAKDLNNHRTQNLMGAMMRHHHMNSTKYLSKWIEAKNKQ